MNTVSQIHLSAIPSMIVNSWGAEEDFFPALWALEKPGSWGADFSLDPWSAVPKGIRFVEEGALGADDNLLRQAAQFLQAIIGEKDGVVTPSSLFGASSVDPQVKEGLEERASRAGLDFPFALKMIFDSAAPRERIRILEEKAQKCEEGGFRTLPPFEDLSREEKIGLYALFRRKRGKHIPSFTVFLRYLRAVLDAVGYGENILKTFRCFSTTFYSDHVEGWDVPAHTPYDILVAVDRKLRELNVGDRRDLLRRTHNLLKKSLESPQNMLIARKFMLRLNSGISFPWQIRMALALWQGDTTGKGMREFFKPTELSTGAPVVFSGQLRADWIEDFGSFFDVFSSRKVLEKPVSRMTFWERAALYYYAAFLHMEGKIRFEAGFPAKEEFMFYMLWESQRIAFDGKPILVQALIEKIKPHFAHPVQDIPKVSSYGKLARLPEDLYFRCLKKIRSGEMEFIKIFLIHLEWADTAEKIRVAYRLAAKNTLVSGMFFEKLFKDPERERRLAELGKRSLRLEMGSPLLSQGDPFEISAAALAVGGGPIRPYDFQRKLFRVRAARPISGVNLGKVVFKTHLQALSIPESDVKPKLGEVLTRFHAILRPAEYVLTADKRQIPRMLRPMFEELQQALKSSDAERIFQGKLDSLLKAWSKLIPVPNPAFFDEWMLVRIKENSRDLIGGLPPNLREAGEEELIETLSTLYEFYWDRFAEKGRKIRSRDIQWCLKRLETLGAYLQGADLWETTVTLLPSRTLLDAFAAVKAGNCLADSERREHFILYSLTDPHYVPFRILVGGRWRGTVMTQTYLVGHEGRKIKVLILHGMDPERSLHLNPNEFVRGLVGGFKKMAKKRGYDMVLIPQSRGLQSTRPQWLHPAIARLKTTPLHFMPGFRFPKTGPGRNPGSYYNPKELHRDFLIL